MRQTNRGAFAGASEAENRGPLQRDRAATLGDRVGAALWQRATGVRRRPIAKVHMSEAPLPLLPNLAHEDCIVVVHGFAGSRLCMRPLCWRLRAHGCRVDNWGYASLRGAIAEHAQRLFEHLAMSLSKERRIHIVAHSMGAIVARTALSTGRPLTNLGRVVLLAPPNHGTPVARYAAKIVGRVCQGIADLSDHDGSFVSRLPSPNSVDIGIIAARFDVLVPVANTHLDGERHHVVLNATHNSLLFSRAAANHILAFIATGRFERGR